MNSMHPKVDGYVRTNKKRREELENLRRILRDCPLTEEVKWRVPCYTFQDRNVAILGAFKESCVLSFVKGALLEDAHGILSKPGENTQAARVIRFTHAREIVEMEPVLKAYISEALDVEKAGLKVQLKKIAEHHIPEELQNKLYDIPALKTAFHALMPGQQRAYPLYFSAAKQAKTRESRIEQSMPQILSGKGLDD
jgi:uncharacterized protein YdeI (YjbR/CyaY-like superfamily)